MYITIRDLDIPGPGKTGLNNIYQSILAYPVLDSLFLLRIYTQVFPAIPIFSIVVSFESPSLC